MNRVYNAAFSEEFSQSEAYRTTIVILRKQHWYTFDVLHNQPILGHGSASDNAPQKEKQKLEDSLKVQQQRLQHLQELYQQELARSSGGTDGVNGCTLQV